MDVHAAPGKTPAEALADLRDQRDALSAEIGRRKASGEDVSDLIERNRELSGRAKRLERELATAEAGEAPQASSGWTTDIVTDEAGFEGLREDWRALLERSAPCSPFTRWEWLFPWWRHFGGGKPLRIVTVRDERANLVALAPLMIGLQERLLARRTLTFIGSGLRGPAGQCFQVITQQGLEDAALHAVWATVGRFGKEFDVLRMWRVADDDQTWRTAITAARWSQQGLSAEPAGKAVHGELRRTYAEFVANMPSSVERNLVRNQYAKLRQKYSQVQFGLGATPCDVSRVLPAVMDFSVRRQKQLRSTSKWAEPDSRECLLEAAGMLSQAGHAWVAHLSLDGRLAAGAMTLTNGDALHIYCPAFDDAFAQENVMHALYACLVEQAIERGMSRIDWLSDHPYQRRFVGGERLMLNIDVPSNSRRSSERSARGAWLRALRRRLKAVVLGLERPPAHQ